MHIHRLYRTLKWIDLREVQQMACQAFFAVYLAVGMRGKGFRRAAEMICGTRTGAAKSGRHLNTNKYQI